MEKIMERRNYGSMESSPIRDGITKNYGKAHTLLAIKVACSV